MQNMTFFKLKTNDLAAIYEKRIEALLVNGPTCSTISKVEQNIF